METRVSTKGQVVLPGPLRRKLGIRAGDHLDVKLDADSIVLTPRRQVHLKAAIIEDPITGIPALSFGSDAPILTSKEIEEMLAEFP